MTTPLACAHCGASLQERRSDAVYCSERCAHRARRRRNRGVPIDAYPEGANRGRAPMGRKTAFERAVEFEITKRNAHEAASDDAHLATVRVPLKRYATETPSQDR